MILEVSTNSIGDCVGVDPRDIALVFGDRIFSFTSFFGDWKTLIDIEDLKKTEPSIYTGSLYKLGNVTYFPCWEKYCPHRNFYDVDFIEVSWKNGTEYDSHCTLYPLENHKVLKVQKA